MSAARCRLVGVCLIVGAILVALLSSLTPAGGAMIRRMAGAGVVIGLAMLLTAPMIALWPRRRRRAVLIAGFIAAIPAVIVAWVSAAMPSFAFIAESPASEAPWRLIPPGIFLWAALSAAAFARPIESRVVQALTESALFLLAVGVLLVVLSLALNAEGGSALKAGSVLFIVAGCLAIARWVILRSVAPIPPKVPMVRIRCPRCERWAHYSPACPVCPSCGLEILVAQP